MADREAEKGLLRGIEGLSENARVLLMTEGEETLGWVAVDLVELTLRMLKFHVETENDMERNFYLDTLMRSAASYGETNGADRLETAGGEMNDFLRKRGFETDATHAFAPMSLIVHYE